MIENPWITKLHTQLTEQQMLLVMEAIRWGQKLSVDELADKLHLKVMTNEMYQDLLHRD